MEDLLEGTLFEKDDDFTEGWIELSACCYNCGRIVSAKADIDRLDKFVAMCDTHRHPDNLDYWGGPMFAAIDPWTESPHWYRELILVVTAATRVQDYYCDTCFNHNYPKGIIETADQLRNHMRCKLFMEEQGDNASWDFTTLDESTRLWRKQIWDDVTARVFSNK